MAGRRKIPPRIPTEDFSMEIGDINGVKLYEIKKIFKQKGAKKEK
ncbi:hypothetical protein ACIFOT_24965 [Neobacillus sp. NRS-1170]